MESSARVIVRDCCRLIMEFSFHAPFRWRSVYGDSLGNSSCQALITYFHPCMLIGGADAGDLSMQDYPAQTRHGLPSVMLWYDRPKYAQRVNEK